MSEINKLSEEALENVIGGAKKVINNSNAGYANVLTGPGLGYNVAHKLVNGTPVETTGNKIKADGYTWYELMSSDGKTIGWITGNLLA